MGGTPSAPTYNTSASLAEQNRINQAAGIQQYANVSSPLGGYSISVDPVTGQMTVNKSLSDNSELALQQQKKALNSYTGDPTAAANAYYNAQMSYLQPQMDRQIERAESSLTNRGLPLGSNAWNNYMGDIYDTQNRTLSALSDEALLKGQNYQSNILNQSAMLGGQVIDPTMVEGQGGAGLENTEDKRYEAAQQQYQTEMARANARMSAIGQGVGSAIGLGSAAIAAASDKRLKTDLRLVGKSDNGLNIYVGKYTKESGLDDGKYHLFLIAQEVQDVVPDAVAEDKNGYLKVDYLKALTTKKDK